MKEVINKLHFIEMKNFYFVKDNVKRIRKAWDWEKRFAKGISDKGLLSKIQKELLILNNKKMDSLTELQVKDLNRQLTEEDTQMEN